MTSLEDNDQNNKDACVSTYVSLSSTWCQKWDSNPRLQLETRLQLASAPTLAYFNIYLPVTITCDASQYGLDAACLQTSFNGDLMPVSYASLTLMDTEQCYAQIGKELLAVVFACSKFKDFVFGKTFTVETDHHP